MIPHSYVANSEFSLYDHIICYLCTDYNNLCVQSQYMKCFHSSILIHVSIPLHPLTLLHVLINEGVIGTYFSSFFFLTLLFMVNV